jgi:hypothetical protein
VAILGLLLLLAAAGLAVDVVVQNTSSISVEAVGATFSISPGWLFVAGLATGAIGLVGVSLLVAGITRARRRGATLAETRTSLQHLQAERDRLAVELERQRAARRSTTVRTGADDGLAGDDDSAVIDLDEERVPAPASDDYVTVRSTAGPEPADDRHDPVGSDRHGLFHRRH